MSRHEPWCPFAAVEPDVRRVLELLEDDDPDLWRTARRVMRRVERIKALLRQHLEPDDPVMENLGRIWAAAFEVAQKASGL